jgi:hypothetical protein
MKFEIIREKDKITVSFDGNLEEWRDFHGASSDASLRTILGIEKV